MNTLDKERLEEKAKALGNKLVDNEAINWFSSYLVWSRVLTERNFLEIFSELINKINKKPITKKVINSSYQLANLVFDYATYKKTITAEEMTNIRSAGTWLGMITLGNNRPIIKKELDIKAKIFKSVEN